MKHLNIFISIIFTSIIFSCTSPDRNDIIPNPLFPNSTITGIASVAGVNTLTGVNTISGTKTITSQNLQVNPIAGNPISGGKYLFRRGSYITFSGKGFTTISGQAFMKFEDVSGFLTYEFTKDKFLVFSSTLVGIIIPKTIQNLNYKVFFIGKDTLVELDKQVVVADPLPVVNIVNTTVTAGGSVTIKGENFLESKIKGYNLVFSNTTNSFTQSPVSDNLLIITPPKDNIGTATLHLYSDTEKFTFDNQYKITVAKPSTAPKIDSVSTTTPKVGSTMTVFGSNLKTKSFTQLTTFQFMPVNSGVTLVATANFVNDDGTIATLNIPNDYTTDRGYIFQIGVDNEYSEEFTELIVFKP